MENSINHYKENSPLDTVRKIRDILFSKNILVTEDHWMHSGTSYYSLSLKVHGTPVSVNGKGVSKELALASAYGEMVERLQNMTVFKLIYDFDDEDYKKYGFYYNPDEKVLTLSHLLNESFWLKFQLQKNKISDVDSLMQLWSSMRKIQDVDGYVSIPFYHYNTQKTDYIPIIMLSKMYTSNGMAAGNTMEEAMVQGISEVFERYASVQLLEHGITPPDIPYEELHQYPEIVDMVMQIESHGYKIMFKDCSLGIGLPVVAVVCVHLSTGRYFVKLGSHPMYQVALERTLTEMLQGQSLDDMQGMRPFSGPIQLSKHDNTIGILINGCGDYPASFFSKDYSYYHLPFEHIEYKNNEDLLIRMMELIVQQGWNLYVRGDSFMGFPACHVLIPGISEVEEMDDIISIKDYVQYNEFKNSIRNLASLTFKERSKLADDISKLETNKNIPPTKWINLENDSLPWLYKNTYWLLCALYCSVGKYDMAHKTFAEFHKSSMFNVYYNCVLAFLGLKAENESDTNIQEALSVFYNEPMIEKVFNEFSQDRCITEENTIRCFDCKNCKYSESCGYLGLRDLYLQLKSFQITK